MNYQLMLQVIATIFGLATIFVGIRWLMFYEDASRSLKVILTILFIITVVTGALAAGLS